MLFHSYSFLFVFLPVVWIGFYVAQRAHRGRATVLWLFLSSLVFYAWWYPPYLLLLLLSLAMNLGFGGLLGRDRWRRRWVLAAGVGANLALIGWFKYAAFGAQVWSQLTGRPVAIDAVALPLAISFFTFQQIGYLVDRYRGLPAEAEPLRFGLFVTFFPQLIAGPIVRHREMGPQLRDPERLRFGMANVQVGLAFLVAGLFKKAVIADGVAPTANAVFDAAAAGTPVGAVDGWLGTAAYSLQIYFDFSGYSDMAIGIALLFGIRLPFNFDSPYKAASIIDFWRRWHMTLSRFLRDYLYIALGGNRRGPVRRYANLMITMLLGGLWHGAGWNFVIWGGLHGAYLLINHGFRALRPRTAPSPAGSFGTAGGRLLTLAGVVVAWVFFRAVDTEAALLVLSGMAGMAPQASAFVEPDNALRLIVPLLGVVLFLPNSQQVLASITPPLDGEEPTTSPPAWAAWRPSPLWAVGTAAAAAWVVLAGLGGVHEFIYFRF